MIELKDGRSELYQWDTGRILNVPSEISQVHYSNNIFGRSVDVDVHNGQAIIPDFLLQTDKDLHVWAFVGPVEDGYTKISKEFKVNKRNKPADYVFTPHEQETATDIISKANKSAEDAEQSAKTASEILEKTEEISVSTPYIGENGNWFIYDAEKGGYIDSGSRAKGDQGIQGEKGDPGSERENLFSILKSEKGYITSTGTIAGAGRQTQEISSEYLSVNAGEVYTLQSWIPEGNAPWIAAAYYTASKGFLSRVTSSVVADTKAGISVARLSLTVPENAAYMRVSGRTYHTGRLQLVEGGTTDQYTENLQDTVWSRNNSLATLLPAYTHDLYPSLSTVDKTFTIPLDTLLVDPRLPNGFIQFNPDKLNNVCKLTQNLACVYYDPETDRLVDLQYDSILIPINYILICSIRIYESHPTSSYIACSLPVSVDGVMRSIDLKQGGILQNTNIRSVNHRGYNVEAPENTLAAYRLSKKKGFTYVECDVRLTSDGVPVLLHDETVDRTSNGTGKISEMTLAEVKALDFGSWKSAIYNGEKIPTFEEFLLLCKNLGLHPYIEVKTGDNEAAVSNLVSLVKRYGMQGKVTWIGGQYALQCVKEDDPKARLGWVTNQLYPDTFSILKGLKTDENEVFCDFLYSNLTDEIIAEFIANDFPVEVWTVNSNAAVSALNPYVTGVTSDYIIAGQYLCSTEI